MKKYLLILFVPLAFWACSKKDENVTPAEPELATPLVGTYNLTYIRFDSATFPVEITLPRTSNGITQSATVTIRRDSASVIYTNYIIRTGASTSTDVFLGNGQFKVRGTTPPYDLLFQGTKVGTADGTNFNLDFSYTIGGTRYREVYTARK